MDIKSWELLSYIVTVIGFPLAVVIFLWERRQERINEEDEVYELLSDNYQDFLRTVLEHSDLHLGIKENTKNLSSDQEERMHIIFSMLIALFERAYLLLFKSRFSRIQKRRWASWEDYISEWCQREDFRDRLPQLLNGKDPEFAAYIMAIAQNLTAKPNA